MVAAPALTINSGKGTSPKKSSHLCFIIQHMLMVKIIDTHSHLYSDKFHKDYDEVLSRAEDVLQAVLLPNIDLNSVDAMHDLAERAPGFCFPMMGLHPCDVQENWEEQLANLKTYLEASPDRYVGIGETGLDLYWDNTTLDRQRSALKVQVQWAKNTQLPIILHARDAIDETADVIEAELNDSLSGVFHCFDGSLDQARRIIGFGSFKIGIGGIVTYRKDVQAVVAELPLESIILETDSPYLPPEPHRKDKPRRNESGYTRYVCQKIADLKGLTYDEVATQTNENALELFPSLAAKLQTA